MTANMGAHLLLDMLVDPKQVDLDDADRIEAHLRELVASERMTVVGVIRKKFEPQGLSLILALAESHVSYHSFPEKSGCSVDFYSCSSGARPSLERIYCQLISFFGPVHHKGQLIDREVLP